MGALEDNLYNENKSLTEVIDPKDWLLAHEVGELFGVKPKTVTRWGDKLANVRKFKTPGGHTRYYKPDVLLVLEQYEDNVEYARK